MRIQHHLERRRLRGRLRRRLLLPRRRRLLGPLRRRLGLLRHLRGRTGRDWRYPRHAARRGAHQLRRGAHQPRRRSYHPRRRSCRRRRQQGGQWRHHRSRGGRAGHPGSGPGRRRLPGSGDGDAADRQPRLWRLGGRPQPGLQRMRALRRRNRRRNRQRADHALGVGHELQCRHHHHPRIYLDAHQPDLYGDGRGEDRDSE